MQPRVYPLRCPGKPIVPASWTESFAPLVRRKNLCPPQPRRSNAHLSQPEALNVQPSPLQLLPLRSCSGYMQMPSQEFEGGVRTLSGIGTRSPNQDSSYLQSQVFSQVFSRPALQASSSTSSRCRRFPN